MGRVKDISNTRVNKLYVTDKKEIRFSSNSKNKKNSASSQRCTYWLCRCDCSKELWVRSDALERKTKKSCGCDKRAGEKGDGVMGVVYAGYRVGARKRSLDFNITKEFFKEITSKDCFYCGSPLSNYRRIKNYYGDFRYNGIDRIDNNVGYEEGNCVPCCKKCNRAKDIMSKDEFVSWVENMYNNLKDKGMLNEDN